MYRRQAVVGLATCSCVGLAGCLSTLMDDLTTYAATPAEVADSVVDETGYEHQRTDEEVEREEVAGETVEMTNYIARYRRSIDIPGIGELDAGVFGTVATPQVSVAGEGFNPIEDMTNREIVENAQEQYAELSLGDSVGTRTAEPLGIETEIETFEGEATISEDTEIDVLVDVARFDHGDDHLASIGGYPEFLSDEAQRVTAMVEGLEHAE